MLRSSTKQSPDSLPSLSATTVTSSSYTDQVVRDLFPEIQDDDDDKFIERYRIGESLRIEIDKESSYGSDISVASEGTYLSIDNDNPNRIEQQKYQDGDSPKKRSEVKIYPGCHGAIHLPPSFASTMFHMFDSSNKRNVPDDAQSTANSVHDAATEVVSNIDHSTLQWERKIDSLEREIATLKGIIKSDSVIILSLKTALSEYQEREILSNHDMVPEQDVCDLSTQQFKEYEETIQHLHDEIEVLTTKEDRENDCHEAQLQLQNELFASQIIETETEIRETREAMCQMVEENAKLSMELLEMRAQAGQEEGEKEMEIIESKINLQEEILTIKKKINEMEQKLESGFYCRCFAPESSDPCKTFTDTNAVDLRNVEPLFNDDVDDESNEDKPTLELNDLDIEVTIDGTIITTAGTEKDLEADENLRASSASKCIGALSDAPMNQACEVAETDCNYCDCLRNKSSSKEIDTQ
jgi:hypothetical protein